MIDKLYMLHLGYKSDPDLMQYPAMTVGAFETMEELEQVLVAGCAIGELASERPDSSKMTLAELLDYAIATTTVGKTSYFWDDKLQKVFAFNIRIVNHVRYENAIYWCGKVGR